MQLGDHIKEGLLSVWVAVEWFLYKKSLGLVWWLINRKRRNNIMSKSKSYLGGALIVSEDSGKLKVTISKSATVGGGKAASVLSVEGEGSITLDGEAALQLTEALVNSKLPSSILPLVEAGEAIINAAVKAIE